MLHVDTDTRRQLAREHEAALSRAWPRARLAGPDVVESRRRRRRVRLSWLRTQLRPAGHIA